MTDITAGQHFRDATPTAFGHPAGAWIVTDQVFIGTDGKKYAHVHAESKPHERKTLSTAILSGQATVHRNSTGRLGNGGRCHPAVGLAGERNSANNHA